MPQNINLNVDTSLLYSGQPRLQGVDNSSSYHNISSIPKNSNGNMQQNTYLKRDMPSYAGNSRLHDLENNANFINVIPTSRNLNLNRNRQQNMNPNVDMSLYAGIPGPFDVDHSSGCNNTLDNCNNSVVNLKQSILHKISEALRDL